MAKRKYVIKKRVTGAVERNFHPYTREEGKVKVWEVGDYVIGKYVMKIKDNYKKDAPIIEVHEAKFSNPVLDKEGNEVDIIGKNLQLNRCGTLDYAFFTEDVEREKEPIPVGEIVEIVYKGKEKLTDGEWKGKDSHQVEVTILQYEEEGSDEAEQSEDDCF